MSSDIKEFYRNRNVLITGATGFLGKLIVEKLLRTCEVDGIYLIVRTKKGICPEERLRHLLEEEVFDKVKKSNVNVIKKIRIVEGDLSKKGLGLSKDNIELIKNVVNVVFHCGAFLNMDSKLADAVITNVRGTAEILELMRHVRNLHAFILVSTAYSNCYEARIEEKFYEPPIDPDLLIKITESLEPNVLSNISAGFAHTTFIVQHALYETFRPGEFDYSELERLAKFRQIAHVLIAQTVTTSNTRLIGAWPNCYVYSKAIAENLLLTKGKDLPVGLFRPTIVTSTASEPVPGWSDNLYGPLGILLSSHCGVLRVVRANGDLKSHTVPGDMCINVLLCMAWDINQRWKASSKNYRPPVLNYSAKNSILLKPMREYVSCKGIRYTPFKNAMWYQMLFLVRNKYIYLIVKFLLHTIPAYLIDAILMVLQSKPRMKKLYRKLERVSDTLCYFIVNEWDIENENVLKLWEKLNENDRVVFNFDINTIDVHNYFTNMLNGLKKYILKEDITKSKFHEQRYQRLKLLHFSVKYLLLGFSAYSIFKGLCKINNKAKMLKMYQNWSGKASSC